MKSFTKYFTLTILLLLGVACIGVLYLFFVPGSSLFNIRYISYSNTSTKEFNYDNISTLSVNSRDYDVKITSNEENKIIINVYANSFGFVLTKNAETNIASNTKDGVLTINVTEPHGFAFSNASYVEVSLPKEKTLNLSLSNRKAETFINSEHISINNFIYSTENGDLNLNDVNIAGNLNLTLNKATCDISNSVVLNNSNLNLSITTGKFYANQSTFKDIAITKNERGVIEFKECAQITEDVSSAGGRISAETVSFINVKSSGTNIYINTVTTGAIIELDSGNIEIDSLTGTSSNLKTNSGNISLNNVYSSIVTETDNGNISISNARQAIITKTQYGNITINFNEEAETGSSARYVDAKIKDGKLTTSGLEKVSLLITGNGRAELDMKDVIGESSITGNAGSIFVKVNKDSIYKLTTLSQGNVRVNLTQIPEYNGYTTKEQTITYVNCYENGNNGNSLAISTTAGTLTVLDTNFA